MHASFCVVIIMAVFLQLWNILPCVLNVMHEADILLPAKSN
jgi:hypothetical protein